MDNIEVSGKFAAFDRLKGGIQHRWEHFAVETVEFANPELTFGGNEIFSPSNEGGKSPRDPLLALACVGDILEEKG